LNPREAGFLLLTSHLGDPERRPLTVVQFRELTKRMRMTDMPEENRELEESDLTRLGCDSAMAERILGLLSQVELLDWYVRQGAKAGCVPVTRVSEGYPHALRQGLGMEAPGSLWALGDLSLLENKCVALVGSRELKPENLAFAVEAGRQAALQGYTLVSGNAKGADRAAQNSCLENGGKVISVVADCLKDYRREASVLYLSEESYDAPFSAIRALSRNRVIHCLAQVTLVAQCTLGKGGTWDGTTKNLRHGWSPVGMFDDGSAAARELVQRGAQPVTMDALSDLEHICIPDNGLF